jgi:hypothetical protein
LVVSAGCERSITANKAANLLGLGFITNVGAGKASIKSLLRWLILMQSSIDVDGAMQRTFAELETIPSPSNFSIIPNLHLHVIGKEAE